MKIKRFSSILAIVVTVGAITLSGCRKKKETITDPTDTDTEQTTASDNALSESIATDIESMGSEAADNATIVNYKPGDANGVSATEVLSAAPCATVSIANKIITVDFGSACFGADGKLRSGKLIYDYSQSTPTTSVYYRNPGFKLVVTSQNYVVNGNQVNIINKTVTNITSPGLPPGLNPGSNLTWSVSANIKITKSSATGGGTIDWICNRTKELINTADTNCYKGQGKFIRWHLAKVRINGTASGTNAGGETYTATATNLVRDFQCAPDAANRPHWHPFVGGQLTFTPGSRLPRTIDYGNGGCDRDATLTINGKTYAFIIP